MIPKTAFNRGDNIAGALRNMKKIFESAHWEERMLLSGDVIAFREIISTFIKQTYIVPIHVG
eukprot:Pgem_evm1s8343